MRTHTGVILIPDAGCGLCKNVLFMKAKAEQTIGVTPHTHLQKKKKKESVLLLCRCCPTWIVATLGLGFTYWLLS